MRTTNNVAKNSLAGSLTYMQRVICLHQVRQKTFIISFGLDIRWTPFIELLSNIRTPLEEAVLSSELVPPRHVPLPYSQAMQSVKLLIQYTSLTSIANQSCPITLACGKPRKTSDNAKSRQSYRHTWCQTGINKYHLICFDGLPLNQEYLFFLFFRSMSRFKKLKPSVKPMYIPMTGCFRSNMAMMSTFRLINACSMKHSPEGQNREGGCKRVFIPRESRRLARVVFSDLLNYFSNSGGLR